MDFYPAIPFAAFDTLSDHWWVMPGCFSLEIKVNVSQLSSAEAEVSHLCSHNRPFMTSIPTPCVMVLLLSRCVIDESSCSWGSNNQPQVAGRNACTHWPAWGSLLLGLVEEADLRESREQACFSGWDANLHHHHSEMEWKCTGSAQALSSGGLLGFTRAPWPPH